MEYLSKEVENPHFFVFSDDIQVVQEKYSFPDCTLTFVEAHSGKDSYLDLYLMTRCKHFIIANSTFSWWGAWLGTNQDKIVIGPKKWFADPSIDTRDICPSSWILI